MVNLAKAGFHLSAFVALILTLSSSSSARAEDRVEHIAQSRWLSPPTYAIKSIRDAHSSQTPVIVAQGELDALINQDGGGACPISTALIALQTLRSMTGHSLHPQPHRFALQLFQKHPELKQGRITNERFVDLLSWMSDQITGYDIQVETVSDLGDRVRDLMGLRIADGTTDVMRMTVVREKYGFDLWEMSVRSYSVAPP